MITIIIIINNTIIIIIIINACSHAEQRKQEPSRKKAVLCLSLVSVIEAFEAACGGGVVITTVLRANTDLYTPRLDSDHLQALWACMCAHGLNTRHLLP